MGAIPWVGGAQEEVPEDGGGSCPCGGWGAKPGEASAPPSTQQAWRASRWDRSIPGENVGGTTHTDGPDRMCSQGRGWAGGRPGHCGSESVRGTIGRAGKPSQRTQARGHRAQGWCEEWPTQGPNVAGWPREQWKGLMIAAPHAPAPIFPQPPSSPSPTPSPLGGLHKGPEAVALAPVRPLICLSVCLPATTVL